MKIPLLIGSLAATLGAATAAPALAQSADLQTWTAVGDVLASSPSQATLTTAYSDEAPVSAGAAWLYFDLESALSLPVGTLAADTVEGSGLQQGFAALAGTTLRFDWRLSSVKFDAAQADRAFVLIDGDWLAPLGTVAADAVTGHFSHTFASAGNHALAIVVMDVATADGVSTLALSNFGVSAVPEPANWALWLAGLGGLALALRSRA